MQLDSTITSPVSLTFVLKRVPNCPKGIQTASSRDVRFKGRAVLQGNDVEEAGVRLLFRIARTAILGAVRAEEAQWSAAEQLHAVVVVVPNRAAVAVEVDASGAVDCQH